MASEQTLLTNRKLNYAKIQLRAVQQFIDSNEGSVPQSSSALEAGLLFLHQAYVSLLAEIAEAYRHKGDRITSLEQLKTQLKTRDIAPQVLGELERLEAGPSWLNDLLSAQDLLLSVAHRDDFRIAPKEAEETAELQLIDVSGDQQSWVTRFSAAVEGFQSLAEKLREASSEY